MAAGTVFWRRRPKPAAILFTKAFKSNLLNALGTLSGCQHRCAKLSGETF